MRKHDFETNQALTEEITEKLSLDDELSAFFIKHDIPNQVIVNHLNDLLSYKKEKAYCRDCARLNDCKQETLGHQPVLNYTEGRITLSYQPCPYLIEHEKEQATQAFIKAMYMPKMVHQARLSDFRQNNESRRQLYKKMMAIIHHMKHDEPTKGFYITGQYQIGKTYALAALANQFAVMKVNVIIAYYPDLVREIKSSIKSGNLESIINKLKTMTVLMLDDIGGEAPSQWIRDEVLGPILQHRLLDNKLTFFSSNVPLKELGKYMTESDQHAEKMKAYRIIERIKNLTEETVLE